MTFGAVILILSEYVMYKISLQAYTASDIVDQGTYNLFITETEHYNPKVEDFESSAHLFHNAFPAGFVCSLVEVFSGPPNVSFKWRHWGTFTGRYKDFEPTGETIEVVGMSVARVSDDLKIESVEHYFDTNAFLEKLTSGQKSSSGDKLESGCPFHS
ncbi:hypothetical protein DSM106972_040530 [Dulcicalothrix desertica PCC 7102]|uniref:SnoaL-like polyketide cyclase n=1 Tax=Dulcicalothrix desertica PCC 7102 TaxID=232991 RepID=A0A3S1ANM7_9CYAN|nr:hypothetical protein DSM106972_040530 [Dulcicalothrix desertica PCC 7102]TWH43265.1 hypothetical protein CAL7102_06973 [Dulcicalothrix desertica PCC 7102]